MTTSFALDPVLCVVSHVYTLTATSKAPSAKSHPLSPAPPLSPPTLNHPHRQSAPVRMYIHLYIPGGQTMARDVSSHSFSRGLFVPELMMAEERLSALLQSQFGGRCRDRRVTRPARLPRQSRSWLAARVCL